MAAVDYFLKLDGIDGESTAAGHEKWIEIESFSWGLTNAGAHATTGGAGAAKAVPSDFTLTLPFSSASPQMFQKAVSGDSFSFIQIDATKAQRGSQGTYLTYKLTDVLISALSTEGGGTAPVEQVSFAFAKVEVSYSPQTADGSLATPLHAGFDFLNPKAS